MPLDFAQPAALLLLPLAGLPLLRRRDDSLPFPHLGWLPVDSIGRALAIAWRSAAVLSITCIVLGLAGPGEPGARVQRTGRGAEVLILMDRSSSMDAIITPKGVLAAGSLSEGDSKNSIVRTLLARFVAKRHDDRFALMTFSTRPMLIVPFTERSEVVQAGLAATGIGRGLPNTDMGSALLAAIAQFDGRVYSGSRIVLVVSDGGAQLDETTRRRIEAGLSRHRIGLYWIYVRSSGNSPDLMSAAAAADDSAEELALHRFFGTLATPYRLFQADDSNALAAAIAEIERQQNQPLNFFERVPRRDRSGVFFTLALVGCVALVAWRMVEVRGWS
ncbi:vWA domain-containing protein [Aquabacterium sp.]|uniref:vWA domain-containing protein n=1 Tax=Aquabacterium sp. TaxID=1872578 RepID=UPI002C5523A9|nr:vWA domain-containing protein [Aquabacterium sp.]HSW06556.1 vWA domain-containing protein [Aquabacterium sp.]